MSADGERSPAARVMDQAAQSRPISTREADLILKEAAQRESKHLRLSEGAAKDKHGANGSGSH